MTKQEKILAFDPNGVGLKNGNFIGLPFDENDADIVLLPVPWDVTVSYRAGTATAGSNILEASSQLDLYDNDLRDAWQRGIYMRPVDSEILAKNNSLRKKAEEYINFLETGGDMLNSKKMMQTLDLLNNECRQLKKWVHEQTAALLERDKIVGLVGGEHSVPLGYLEALAERHEEFGILHIDAHCDLRKAYEGFIYSHASIFYNAAKLKNISRIVQVGIRDYCDEETYLAKHSDGRIKIYTDAKMRQAIYEGASFYELAKDIIKKLPKKVYISFDIDGLSPHLCPNTGTPVPGGFEFQEALFLIKVLRESGKKIIGFDLCETAGIGNEWDGNVAARVLYKLCCSV